MIVLKQEYLAYNKICEYHMNVDKIREVENNINVSLHLFTLNFQYSINTQLATCQETFKILI